MNRKLHKIAFALALFGSLQSIGQINEGEVIDGEAKREIIESHKLSDVPNMHEPNVEQLTVRYNLLSRQVSTDFSVEPIAAAKLNVVEPLDQLYNGYVKAGVGMYLNTLFDLHYNSTRSRTDGWGINLKHFSSNGGVKDKGESKFNYNEAHLFGKKFLRNHVIGANVNYDRHGLRYYGFDPIIFPDWNKDTILQVFNCIGANAHIKSFFKDSTDWNYEFGVGYYHLSDNNNSKENNIKVDGLFRSFLKNNLLLIAFGLDFNNYKYQSDALYDISPGESFYDNTILTVNPKISSRGPEWKADAGVKIVMDADHTAYFKFFPDIEFKYSLFNDVFVPYVGVIGGIERNSYKTLSDENPFIRPDVTLGEDMENTNNKFKIYGGIRGTLSSALSFNVQASQGRFVNVPMFVSFPAISDTIPYENQFHVEYDTLDVLSVKGEITYQKTEKLTLFLRGEYFSYTPTWGEYAWNRPEYTVSINVVYNARNKLYIKANIYGVGPRKAKSYVFVEGAVDLTTHYAVDLDGYFDMDLGIEYRYTTRLSGFINFNSILGQRYEKWYQYPVQGFNLLGGVTYSF